MIKHDIGNKNLVFRVCVAKIITIFGKIKAKTEKSEKNHQN